MSLCRNSMTLVFDGVRADDGGVPEELTINITKCCLDPSPLYPVEDFDARYDDEFEFSPMEDGVYTVEYVGGVTGVISTGDVLVKINAEREVGRLAKSDTNSLMSNVCVNTDYMFKKALICMAEKNFGCGRNCQAEQYLLKVLEDDCGNNVGDCGCN